jgi:microcystin degradation protein MlrC
MHGGSGNTAPAAGARPLRVGICGFFLECNRWSPVTTAKEFAQSLDIAGTDLQEELRRELPRVLPDTSGFVAAMNRSGPWEPVALRLAAAQPGGPADHAYFDSLAIDIEARLRAAAPLDAVFISSHGAALTTQIDDPDGDLFSRIRAVVGPAVPIVAVFDLHANVSRRMTDAVSAFVAYRTNPHTDLRACGEEAARHLHTLLAQGPGVVELVKLPFVPPATSQLVAVGTPFAELIALGQTRVGGAILNVSLCGGFALADSEKCGFAVVVTAQAGNRARARTVAEELAAAVWASRRSFVSRLTAVADAVAAAKVAGEPGGATLILADVADNPGAGGGGNTVGLMRALVEAGARAVLVGVVTDAALAQEAHALGVGAGFDARFNRAAAGDPFALPYTCAARVLALSDGRFVGRRGFVKGTQRDMGPSVLLDLGGVQVAVISQRQQLLDPAQLDVLGVDLADVRTLVVKSRGHFRAAFDGFAPAERILEVDCPGLTTPNLASLGWKHMPRPVYPLDEDTAWLAPAVASP